MEDRIRARITEATATTPPETDETVVTIRLDNGYCVHGSAPMTGEDGQRAAYADAYRQLPPLFRFHDLEMERAKTSNTPDQQEAVGQ